MHVPLPLLRGLALGAGTFASGLALDRRQPTPTDAEAQVAAAWNLLVLGPVVYAWVRSWARGVRHKSAARQLWDAAAIVLVHSGLYALVHRGMHRVTCLRPVHAFHHRYATDVTPTVGNAVSPFEFALAYLLPFVAATAWVRATEASLFGAACVVSGFNLVVHAPSVAASHSNAWPAWLVDPQEHLEHHRARGGAPYAAPTLAVERHCAWLYQFLFR